MGLTFACQRARVAYRIEIWDDRETRPKTDRADGRSRGTARCFRRSSQAAWPAAGDKHRLNVFWLKALQCEAHRSIPNFHSRRDKDFSDANVQIREGALKAARGIPPEHGRAIFAFPHRT